jgi:MFS transporter, DHA1 family, multidrug resistance protein
VLLVAGWRVIFLGFLVIGVIAGLWLWLRQPETLPRERRTALSAGSLLSAAGQVLGHPVTMGYTLGAGFIFGSFIIYLGTSQQIFAELYGQGAYFALWFAFFAGGMAVAMVVNARLVMRYGMRRLSKLALRSFLVLSVVFLGVCLLFEGLPPLWALAAIPLGHLLLLRSAVRQFQRHRHGADGPHCGHGGGRFGRAVLAHRHRDGGLHRAAL